MCDICGRTICPTGCPNHEKTETKGGVICGECGGVVPIGTLFYRFPTADLCVECAERLDAEGLERLFRLSGRGALLNALGAFREWSV